MVFFLTILGIICIAVGVILLCITLYDDDTSKWWSLLCLVIAIVGGFIIAGGNYIDRNTILAEKDFKTYYGTVQGVDVDSIQVDDAIYNIDKDKYLNETYPIDLTPYKLGDTVKVTYLKGQNTTIFVGVKPVEIIEK